MNPWDRRGEGERFEVSQGGGKIGVLLFPIPLLSFKRWAAPVDTGK